MAKYSVGASVLSNIDLHGQSTVKEHRYGQLFQTVDGRVFRFGKAGAVLIVPGDLQQAKAEDLQFDQMAVQAASAVGSKTIALTLGSTATVANDHVEGTLAIDNTATSKQLFAIVSNTTAAGGATATFEVEEEVAVALTTSETATVRPNAYDRFIISPTTQTGTPVGGSLVAIAASSYGFLQVGGIGFALSDATVSAAATMSLSPSVATAGCVTKQVTLSSVVGRSMIAVNTSAKAMQIMWQLG